MNTPVTKLDLNDSRFFYVSRKNRTSTFEIYSRQISLADARENRPSHYGVTNKQNIFFLFFISIFIFLV